MEAGFCGRLTLLLASEEPNNLVLIFLHDSARRFPEQSFIAGRGKFELGGDQCQPFSDVRFRRQL